MARNDNGNMMDGINHNGVEYMSVNQAASALGVDAGVIRRAMKEGRVRTKSHPWGVRVLLSDVAQLRRTPATVDRETRLNPYPCVRSRRWKPAIAATRNANTTTLRPRVALASRPVKAGLP